VSLSPIPKPEKVFVENKYNFLPQIAKRYSNNSVQILDGLVA
jgi:hypothetical protein